MSRFVVQLRGLLSTTPVLRYAKGQIRSRRSTLAESPTTADGYRRVGCGTIAGIVLDEADHEASPKDAVLKLWPSAAQTQRVRIY